MLAAQPSLRGFDMTQLDALTENAAFPEKLQQLTQLLMLTQNQTEKSPPKNKV